MEQQPVNSSFQEQEIDLMEIARKIWKRRKFILKSCGIGTVLGLVIAFSIPKEYKTEVKLSPENLEKNRMGQLGSLAALTGVNLNGTMGGKDALSVELYPDIVKSTPFILELTDVPVETKKGNIKTTFYDYMLNHQKQEWWGYIINAPFLALDWGISLLKKEKEEEGNALIDPFKLTKKQEDFINGIRGCLKVAVDEKSGVITASISIQDPLISATIIDVVISNLQKYITDYRTRKAKHDLVFSEKLHTESRAIYYNIQKMYAAFVDANKNVISATFKTEEGRLRNEMELAFNVYNQMSQQLEVNKVKVQEVTPVYTVIEPARVPLRADKPKKPFILFAFVFFAGIVSITWVLGKDVLMNLK